MFLRWLSAMIVDFSIIVMLQAACHSWKCTLERFRFTSSEVGLLYAFSWRVNLFEQPGIKERTVWKRKLSPCKGGTHTVVRLPIVLEWLFGFSLFFFFCRASSFSWKVILHPLFPSHLSVLMNRVQANCSLICIPRVFFRLRLLLVPCGMACTGICVWTCKSTVYQMRVCR